MLDNEKKQYLIELIEKDKPIPSEFKNELFPIMKEEYELVYSGKMREEDILGNEDGTFPLPLQVERIFNNDKFESFEDDWKNMIVFGDNLQLLKTIYEDKNPLIKDKVKGKVKLIYIDPPFATQDEFQNKEGAKAYNDKKQGAEFLEFIRRRLVLAREILADDGSIYVHLDQKMGHYVQAIMDEVFGKTNFANEIIWNYGTYIGQTKNNFPRKHDNIYFYKKGRKDNFTPQRDDDYESDANYKRWKKYFNEEKQILGDNYPVDDSKFDGYVKRFEEEHGRKPSLSTDVVLEVQGKVIDDVWYIPSVNPFAKERIDYPTQKPEALLERIIAASTVPGDLVLDFFGGSGTTMAVAEKMGRRWIACDLGKLSYFTMQKRLLKIDESKDLKKNEDYSEKPRAFMTSKLGMYDLKETLSMEWTKYQEFVSQLFEFNLEETIINGVPFEGNKRSFPVKIFNYEKFKDTSIDSMYLNNLVNSLGSSAPSRIYIVSPASRVKFLADYEEIEGTRFYFLEVPYEMIEELHKTPFVKFRQPKSKSKINAIEEMKGFQFIDKPDVSCKLVKDGKEVKFIIENFESYSIKEGYTKNFSTLSSIYVNYDSNNEVFIMDDVRFWDQLESTALPNTDTEIVYNNDEIEKIIWSFEEDTLGENPMFIISDVYGNDFTVKPVLEVGDE